MGIDYLVCGVCGEAFPDVMDYGNCSNCESCLCEGCKGDTGEKYGVIGEGHELTDDFGECAPLKCDSCTDDIDSVKERMHKVLSGLSNLEKEVLMDELYRL